MYGPKTRAALRDDVRRAMSQVPPIDTGVGIAGAVPVRNPWPTNPLCNQMIDASVAFLSRKGKLAGDATPELIPIPAQTANGPLSLSLQDIGQTLAVNDVKRIAWYDSGGTVESLLIPDNRENLDRNLRSLMTQPPATPQRWWVEASRLQIWPAPQNAGTLSAMFGIALWSQSQTLDGELLELIPTDYVPLVVWKTVSLLCGTQPDDAVLRDLMQLADREIADMLPDFMAFCARRNRTYEAHIIGPRVRSGIMMGRR